MSSGSTLTPVERCGPYLTLVWLLRLAWVACSVAVTAMVLCFVLRSPWLAGLYGAALVAAVAVVGAAALAFTVVLARTDVSWPSEARGLSGRASTVVVFLLVDVLDRP